MVTSVPGNLTKPVPLSQTGGLACGRTINHTCTLLWTWSGYVLLSGPGGLSIGCVQNLSRCGIQSIVEFEILINATLLVI